jgi:hypothetical protein
VLTPATGLGDALVGRLRAAGVQLSAQKLGSSATDGTDQRTAVE